MIIIEGKTVPTGEGVTVRPNAENTLDPDDFKEQS